jgi:N-lysine methyltransferase SETD6
MVPVGDILNAISKNNAQLCFEERELQIVTTKSVKKDEEIFNTYGENSNTDLLHMYGYVETMHENMHDCVEIPTKCFIEAFKKQSLNSEQLFNMKLESLKELDLIDDNLSFIIGIDGVLNEEECLHMLQVYYFTFLNIGRI